jgi:hypothetical protein
MALQKPWLRIRLLADAMSLLAALVALVKALS